MRGHFKNIFCRPAQPELLLCSKNESLRGFHHLIKAPVALECPPTKSLIFLLGGDKAVLEQSCFSVRPCAVLSRTSNASRCPSNRYLPIVAAQIFQSCSQKIDCRHLTSVNHVSNVPFKQKRCLDYISDAAQLCGSSLSPITRANREKRTGKEEAEQRADENMLLAAISSCSLPKARSRSAIFLHC